MNIPGALLVADDVGNRVCALRRKPASANWSFSSEVETNSFEENASR